eukprot:g62966.t1
MHTFAIHSYFCRVRLGVSWTDIFHVQLFEPHVYLLYSYVALGRFVVYRYSAFYVEFTLYSFLLELHLTCYVQLFRRTTAISLH